MREGIHPEYREVVFHDTSIDHYFVIGSTLKTERTIEWQGKTYPYVTIEVSSKSHPFLYRQTACYAAGRSCGQL